MKGVPHYAILRSLQRVPAVSIPNNTAPVLARASLVIAMGGCESTQTYARWPASGETPQGQNVITFYGTALTLTPVQLGLN